MSKKSRLAKGKKSATSLSPFTVIARVLAFVGKPFYFVLSRLIIALLYVFYGVGHVAALTYSFILGKISKALKPARRGGKLTTLPSFFRLEWLRINLFELLVWKKIKSLLFVTKKPSCRAKLGLKLRLGVIVPMVLLTSLALAFYFLILRGLPSPKDLTIREPEVSTKIYDRNGTLLYKIYKDKNRTIIPLSSVPPHVRFATLAAEDAEFYDHPGFSLRGISRALITDIKTDGLQGGSTITQQLVKNALLTPEKTLTRKIKEVILSIQVEGTYTKDQILEMYLNEVSFGGTAYGIEEAARQYFGKNVPELDLAEAAFLAGLPKSPTLYSPFGPNPELAFSRQKEVLRLMVINRYVTREQADEAGNKKLSFVANKTEIKAPHFVMYVRQILVDKYGEDMVEKGGLEVMTTLDFSVQEAAEKIVRDEIERLKNLRVGNGAALVINPQTGEVLAMVGSKDYFDTTSDGNVNVLIRLRQPGSSIKLVNYAYALENGYTPASIIDDSPITYVIPGTTPYSPVNYDGQFIGNVTLRNAFAQSRNIPAVKVLASYGVPKMIEQGQKMGITTWTDTSQYGLSLTLGGGAVKAIELAQVYATVANMGNRPDLMPILQIKDYKGRILEKNSPQITSNILDPRVAFSLIDILKDNFARSPEFGLNSYLVVKDHPEVAAKTGTSNDLRDNWTVGFNQNYLVLAWVGNNDNSPMSRIASGVTGASPIWNKIMSALLAGQASIDWKAPEGMSRVNICSLTGTLPCNGCPTRQEWFLDETKPTRACTQEQIQSIINPTPIPGGQILDSAASVGPIN